MGTCIIHNERNLYPKEPYDEEITPLMASSSRHLSVFRKQMIRRTFGT